MENEYQLKDPDDLGINYRYSNDKLVNFLTLVEQREGHDGYLTTTHEVITAWAYFAKQALEGEYAESNLKCWEGHYEQFGIVMLHHANMSRYRKDHKENWNEFFESAIPIDCYDHLYQGPSGTEDRRYYRVWFSLIGHPDFLSQSIIGPENLAYKCTELELCIAFDDFNRSLRARNI